MIKMRGISVKRLILIMICIASILSSFTMGFYYCKEIVVRGENDIINIDINRIAIVNMDEGVENSNEKILYSNELLKFASDYVNVGLNEAIKGIQADMYAAYILIPSDFSECIQSINGTPNQVRIEYNINSNLTDRNRLEIERKLVSFGERLNSNAAYVYLSSVLDEFHNVQDSANIILEHDKKDLETIKKINPDDIFHMIDFSKMEKSDKKIEDLDVTQYISKNDKEVTNIISAVDKGITEGKQQYQAVEKQYGEVSKGLDNIKELTSRYDSLTDENGNVVYQSGLESLDKAINKYNADTDTKIQEGAVKLEETVVEVSDEYINKVLSSVQKNVDSQLGEIQEHNSALVKEKVKKWEKEQNEYYKELNNYVNAYIGGYKDKMKENHTNLNKAVNDSGDKLLGKIKNLNKETFTKAEVMEYLESCTADSLKKINEHSNAISIQEIEFSEFKEKTPPDFFNDTIILPEVKPLDVSEKEEKDQEEIKSIENEETDKISIEVREGIDTKKDLEELVAGKEKELEEILKEEKDKIYISTSEITGIIDEQIVGSVKNQNEKNLTSYNLASANLTSNVQKYSSMAEEFNPYHYIKKKEITKHQTSLSKNIMALGTAVNTKNTEYLEFVNNLYDNTNENITILQGDMEKANNASKKELNHVISKLKEDKESISQEDDEILNSFTGKLAYTRMGSLEYTEMYKFMVDPIGITKQDEGNKSKNADATEGLTLNYKWLILLALMFLMFIIITGLLMKIVQGRKELKALENE